ncbi:MAG: hypothetical protein ACM3MH_09385 [Actinomycetota bacterium]
MPLTNREGLMKTTIRLALVALFTVGLLATTGIGSAQAKLLKHHIFACPGKPGTIAALFCPAK